MKAIVADPMRKAAIRSAARLSPSIPTDAAAMKIVSGGWCA